MFTYMIVKDPEILEKVYRFRYTIMHDELQLIKTHESGLDVDVYDPYSIHLAALDASGEVCAAMRFILKSPIGYPTENNMDFSWKPENREALGEYSRIFIAKKVRGMRTTKAIVDNFNILAYACATENKVKYLLGAMEENFIRLLQMFKVNYQVIGEGKEYYGFRYPCVLKLEDLVKDNPHLFK